MRIVTPITMTDGVLASSTVAESTYAEWDVSDVYVTGNHVYLASTHREYEAVAGSTGQNPATDDGTYWLNIGATNRWKVFDQHISDPLTNASPVSFVFTVNELSNSVVFFGLVAASINVYVNDPDFDVDTIYNQTQSLIDDREVIDWYSWLTAPIIYATEAIFTDVPIYSGANLYVDVTGSGTLEVGQMVIGRDFALGDTTIGTTVGITDYSTKDRDAFGNAVITEREFAQKAEFHFAFNAQTTRYVQKVLAAQRAVPSVFYVGDDTLQFGTMVYGFYSGGFDIDLAGPEIAFATLAVEGLV